MVKRADCRQELSKEQTRSFQSSTRELARIAEQAYSGFKGADSFQRKCDGTRVTRLDRKVECLWRDYLRDHFPSHSVIGEELGRDEAGEAFCWYLDPVDGTDDLTRGIPLFGYIAALNFHGHPVAAITGHPSLGIQSSALYGQGTFVNSEQIRNLNGRVDDEPAIAMPAAAEFLREGDKSEMYRRLGVAFPNHRIYRNVFAHTAVLTGALEAAVELDVAEWDVLATRLLIEEAGGCYVSIGERTDNAGVRRVSAAFGIASVVDRIVQILSFSR